MPVPPSRHHPEAGHKCGTAIEQSQPTDTKIRAQSIAPKTEEKKETHPKNRPEERIRNTKPTKQKPLIDFPQHRKPFLRRYARRTPDTEHAHNLRSRTLRNRHITRVPSDEVRVECAPKHGEAGVHHGHGAAG